MSKDTDIHSCSYFCDRPACIKAQRDELRKDAERLNWIAQQELEDLFLSFLVDHANHEGRYCVCGDSCKPGYGPTLRAAIDAARGQP